MTRAALSVSADIGTLSETPCVVISEPRLEQNLGRMAALAARAGVRLRPHVKTHKSLALAALQMSGGAVGLTASKADEAIVFLEGGAPSVTAAYPIRDARKLDRLFACAARLGADLRMIADSTELVEILGETGRRQLIRPGVFLKVDVGLGRVGVDPLGDEALAVARAAAAHPHLNFRGLLSHAGHAYAAPDAIAIAEIAEAERRTLLALAARLRTASVPVEEISVGSTPSVLGARDFKGLTEIRPGNYVFLDMTAVRLGLARLEDVALTVLTTVVSRNDRYAIVDAGSKVLSSDKGAHGTDADGYGRAYPFDAAGCCDGPGRSVARLSEEHGWVEDAAADLKPGDRLRIVPNHSCVVANLVGRAWLEDALGVGRPWIMDARGVVL